MSVDRSSSLEPESASHPLYAELFNKTKQQLVEILRTENVDTSRKKADLVERLFQKKSKTEEASSSATQDQTSTSSSTTGASEFAKIFQLFDEQQGPQEQRFLKQMEEFHQEFEDFIDSNADLQRIFCRSIMMCNCSI